MKTEKLLVKIFSEIGAKLILGKSDIAAIINQRYPNMKSLIKLSLNRLCFSLNSSKTYTPITAIFESTNTCDLSCTTCFVNRGMKRKKGFLDINLYKRVLDANKNIASVQLYNWGEPLLHPNLIEMIKFAKSRHLVIRIVTNGTKLDTQKAKELLDTDIDYLCISVDGATEKTYSKVRNFDYKIIEKNIKNFVRLRNDLKKNTFVEVSMVVFKDTESDIDAFREKWSKIVDRVQIQPRMTYNATGRENKCFEPWRGNLIVLWDGRVVLCCVDSEGELQVGDVNKNLSLSKILNSDTMTKLRQQHLSKNYPRLCSICNEYESQKTSKRFS